MAVDWGSFFDDYGIKVVSPTDKSKNAYVPTSEQRRVIEGAGILPSPNRPADPFTVLVLGDEQTDSVIATYYYSTRSGEAERAPEPRLGRELITSWLDAGDEVLIGRIGSELFALKTASAPATDAEAVTEIADKGGRKAVIEKAKRAAGKPARRVVTRNDFVRDPWVVAGVLARSNGKCEMPGCSCALFDRDDGTAYLEVHHVVPLAEGGDDSLVNAAAICPRCHRLLHHGKDRQDWRARLAAHIPTIPI